MREMDGQIKRGTRFFASPRSRLDPRHGAEIRPAPAPVRLLDDQQIAIPIVGFLRGNPLFSKFHRDQGLHNVKYRRALPLLLEAGCSRFNPIEMFRGGSMLLTLQPIEMLRGYSRLPTL